MRQFTRTRDERSIDIDCGRVLGMGLLIMAIVGLPATARANSMASGQNALDPGKRITSLASPTASEQPGSSGGGSLHR